MRKDNSIVKVKELPFIEETQSCKLILSNVRCDFDTKHIKISKGGAMKKTYAVAIMLLLSLTLAGCAELAKSMYGGQQAAHKGANIYKGQSTDSVEKALGSPDVVSSGQYACKNASSLPFGVMPGRNTVEWVYIDDPYSTVIYFDFGRVNYVHQIPTSQVRR